MQEDLNHRSVVITMSAVKMSARLLAKALQAAARKRQRQPTERGGKPSDKSADPEVGKVTIAELQAQSKDGLQKIPIDDDNIGAFEPIARKYGITYALTKDESEEPPKWAVFFRAKDSEVLNVAFAEFTKHVLSPEQSKPSALQQIREFVAEMAERVTHRNRDKVRERSGPEL